MNVQGISPSIVAPLIGQSAIKANAATSNTSSSSSSGSSAMSSSNLESTFLNLLVTELQNQDPTQPVDPTAMVGQMVSLNQLDQLISINQALQGIYYAAASTPTSSGSGQIRPSPVSEAASASPRNVAANSSTVPQVPAPYAGATGNSGLMNLYGSFGLPGTSTNSIFTGAR